MVIVAIPWAVAALVAAVAYMLSAMAARGMFEPFAQSLGENVPLIGSQIASALSRIIAATQAKAEAWADQGVTPLGRTIAAVPIHLAQLGVITIALLTALVGAVQNGAQQATDTAAGAIGATLGAAVTTLQQQWQTFSNQTVPALQASINWVGAEGVRLYQEAAVATAASIDGLRSDIERRMAALGAAIDGQIVQVEARVLQQVRGIEAGITDSFQRMLDALRGEIYPRIDALTGRVGAVEGTMARDIPNIAAQVGTLAGTLEATRTLTDTIARTLTDEITNCIEPMCDNLKPEIPNIRAALEILELGLLAAMVTDAIVEPIPAAHRTDTLVSGPINAVVSTLLAPVRAA